jgi:hypothetical protein
MLAERVTRSFWSKAEAGDARYERGVSAGAVERAERRWGGRLTVSGFSVDCPWDSRVGPCEPHRVDRFACVGRLEYVATQPFIGTSLSDKTSDVS